MTKNFILDGYFLKLKNLLNILPYKSIQLFAKHPFWDKKMKL